MRNITCIQPFHSSVCSRAKGCASSRRLTLSPARATSSHQRAQKWRASRTLAAAGSAVVRSQRYTRASTSDSSAPARQAAMCSLSQTWALTELRRCAFQGTFTILAKMAIEWLLKLLRTYLEPCF